MALLKAHSQFFLLPEYQKDYQNKNIAVCRNVAETPALCHFSSCSLSL